MPVSPSGASNAAHGTELWRTNGTAAGTKRVSNIGPGAADADPSSLAAVGKRLYFSAIHPNKGEELYVTNGTRSGTRLVKDIVVGPNGSEPAWLTAFDGKVFFRAETPTNGTELW